jgi:cytochrome bd-type quinol oxidase subunit 2
MAEAVYILCSFTSILCAVLLFRGYRTSHTTLLFWSSLCFFGLALHNLVLLFDVLVFPDVDLRLWRGGSALVAMMVLIWGLVSESP